jgi:hypothetical protein
MSRLISFFARLFAPKIFKAFKSGNASAIATQLANTRMVVVGANIGNGVSIDALPAEADQIPKLVEAAARMKQYDGVLKFESDGNKYLPIFDDAAAANAFCGAYVDLLCSVHAFRLFTVSASAIVASLDDSDTVIFNAQNDDEVELTNEQTRRVKGLLRTNNSAEPQFLSVTVPVPGVEEDITFTPNRQ